MRKRPNDAHLARQWQRDLALEDQEQLRRSFLARLSTTDDRAAVRLARTEDARDQGHWLGLSAPELLKSHAWITGATGSGKSFLVLGLLWQLLQRHGLPVVLVDLKGELAELLLGTVLPSLTDGPGGANASKVRVIQPFSTTTVPLLRLTDPEPGVSREVQAMNLAASLEDALGHDLGIRMSRVFLRLVSLAIELKEPLTVLTRWLGNPASFLRDSQRSLDPLLREYAREGFGQETPSSLEALSSRLDTFLFLPETRLALSTPRCLSLSDCLDSGVTIIDVGNPPAGAERVARFWAGVLLGRLSRAIMGRQVDDSSPQALLVLEEFQEALSGASIEQFSRLLALSRFKGIALWFVNQQPSQLAAVDSALPKLLRTNTGIEMIFRSNFEDAKALAPAVIGYKGKASAGTPRFEDLTRLPDRDFYLWLKKEAFGAHRVRSPRLDLGVMRKLADRVAPEVRQAIRRGTVSIDRESLEASLQPKPESKRPERLKVRPQVSATASLDLG